MRSRKPKAVRRIASETEKRDVLNYKLEKGHRRSRLLRLIPKCLHGIYKLPISLNTKKRKASKDLSMAEIAAMLGLKI